MGGLAHFPYMGLEIHICLRKNSLNHFTKSPYIPFYPPFIPNLYVYITIFLLKILIYMLPPMLIPPITIDISLNSYNISNLSIQNFFG